MASGFGCASVQADCRHCPSFHKFMKVNENIALNFQQIYNSSFQ